MEYNIDKLRENKTNLIEILDKGINRELLRQKEAGKIFLSDEEINNLIDKVLKGELGDNWKEEY